MPKLASSLAVIAATGCNALLVEEKSVVGTQAEADGLSQKQLAIMRYFSYLTFMSEHDDDIWKGWEVNGKLPDGGGGNTPFGPTLDVDLRYQLSHVAYAAGLMAQRTPAYTEVIGEILRSASDRMLLYKVWEYSPKWFPLEKTNGGSDPIGFKNIMYSGHLTKMMALQQAITGNMTYSENSWEWTYDGHTTSYNLTGAMYAMYDQMFPPNGSTPSWNEKYTDGGVPCEPWFVFMLCNTFPHNAFHLHDGVHGTNFQIADARWQDSVKKHFVNKQPKEQKRPPHGDYFKLLDIQDIGLWTTNFPLEGNDAWALAWVRGWWNESTQEDRDVIYKGYEHFASHAGWKVDKKSGAMHHTGVPPSLDFIATSFAPMIEQQFWHPDSGLERRTEGVMKWIEEFGEFIDTDGDGAKDSYRYAKQGLGSYYRDAGTAALLIGMAFPQDGSANDVVRDTLQGHFFQRHATEPRIAHAEYPSVMVPLARYDAEANILRFQLVQGDAPVLNAAPGPSEVVLTNCAALEAITFNGEPFMNFTKTDATSVSLTAPPQSESPQVWEVRFKDTAAVVV